MTLDELKKDPFTSNERLKGPLAQKFIFPPFSVLNAREGVWQKRKKAWLDLGIKGELGRGAQLIPNGGGMTSKARYAAARTFGSGGPGTLGREFKAKNTYNDRAWIQARGIKGCAQDAHVKKYNHASPGGAALPVPIIASRERGTGSGKPIPHSSATGPKRLTWVAGSRPIEKLDETSRKILAAGGRKANSQVAGGGGGAWKKFNEERAERNDAEETGTSIFDPVLTELAYRWFCPVGGQILDPFAGGSVRGLVAGLLNYRYEGYDLSDGQIAANEDQRTALAPEADIVWKCGDSVKLLDDAPMADFIFSCPPYGDLERYSDNPNDLSTMSYKKFMDTLTTIIGKCTAKLWNNRFACFVIGEYRDRDTGMYRGFVPDTINAFKQHGMLLYNEAILVTAVGSLPLRVNKQFEQSRKLGKTHQNILVFAKGDPSTCWSKKVDKRLIKAIKSR